MFYPSDLALCLLNAALDVGEALGRIENYSLVPRSDGGFASPAELSNLSGMRELCGLNSLHPL